MCRLTFNPVRCIYCSKQQVRETKVLCTSRSRRRCQGVRTHFLVERPTSCSQCSRAEHSDLDLFVPFRMPDSRDDIDSAPYHVEEGTSGPEPCPGYETSASDLPPKYSETRQTKLKTTSEPRYRLATTIRKLGRILCGPQIDDDQLSDREDWMS